MAIMDDAATAFDPQMMFDFPDPYPMFADMRHTQPVAHVTMMTRESWVVSRYDDVWSVLKDGETYSSRANAEVSRFMGRTIIEMDAKEHTRHRALVSAIFTARGIDALQPVIESLVHRLIDGFVAEGRADLVTELTNVFPVQVIAHIVGVPPSDYASFMKWSLDLIAFSKDPQRGLAASAKLRDTSPIVVQAARRAARRRHHQLGRTVVDVGLTRRGDQLPPSLMPAGAETTSRLMGSMFFALLADREGASSARAPTGARPWVIGDTPPGDARPFVASRRRVRSIAGVADLKGGMVSAVIASGNRDETHFPDPDRWDLDRRADDHLSFGFGRHFCLGYHLAKLEARTVVGAALDRLPGLRLDPAAEPPRITGLAFRSPQALRVLFDA
jgi:cytochrome P450